MEMTLFNKVLICIPAVHAEVTDIFYDVNVSAWIQIWLLINDQLSGFFFCKYVCYIKISDKRDINILFKLHSGLKNSSAVRCYRR